MDGGFEPAAGGLGPLPVGGLSDEPAARAAADAGAADVTRALRGVGLHDALVLVVPLALALAAAAVLPVARTVERDRERVIG